ncbi:MAG: hypothetical protein N4A49_08000 [Marinifilaceae bacterium]|jgi:hypothetical protein|nr:hypothetical protein [Marinifilaceae bacterium]
MKNILVFLSIVILAISCDDIAIGYLEGEDAGYNPDSLVVRSVLDPVLDAKRIESPWPWVSAPINGVFGTLPIKYQIAGASSEDGNVEEFLKYIKIRGNGAFEVSVNENIPKGDYFMNIRIYNEDHELNRDRIFKIIVK